MFGGTLSGDNWGHEGTSVGPKRGAMEKSYTGGIRSPEGAGKVKIHRYHVARTPRGILHA